MTSRDNPDHAEQLGQLGEFIRTQRRLAQLSQRELAKLTNLSDPYVSQIERGLHAPSVRVLRALAGALNISAETMLSYAGLLDPSETSAAQRDTESAIRHDSRLSNEQKNALIGVYRSFLTGDA
jgi:transcriptional regulator with XRE-family HTH domain